MVRVAMRERWRGRRSVAMRCHTASRHSRRVAEELMPRSATPRRMKGITVVLSSAPPVRPMLAMLPQKSTVRVSHVRTSPPTLSMAPPKRAVSSGREYRFSRPVARILRALDDSREVDPADERIAAQDLACSGRGERVFVVDVGVGDADHDLAGVEVVQRELLEAGGDLSALGVDAEGLERVHGGSMAHVPNPGEWCQAEPGSTAPRA